MKCYLIKYSYDKGCRFKITNTDCAVPAHTISDAERIFNLHYNNPSPYAQDKPERRIISITLISESTLLDFA